MILWFVLAQQHQGRLCCTFQLFCDNLDCCSPAPTKGRNLTCAVHCVNGERGVRFPLNPHAHGRVVQIRSLAEFFFHGETEMFS